MTVGGMATPADMFWCPGRIKRIPVTIPPIPIKERASIRSRAGVEREPCSAEDGRGECQGRGAGTNADPTPDPWARVTSRTLRSRAER